MRSRRPVGLFLHSWIVFVLLSALPGGATQAQPRQLGLVEQAGHRLVQVDVTVHGPEQTISGLTAADFDLVVDGRVIDEFFLDRVCGEGSRAARTAERPEGEPLPDVGARYLFYFDQHHLTLVGRQRGLEVAREMVRELVRGESRAMIVSSGRTVETFCGFDCDRHQLLDALDRIEKDPLQWDAYPMQEDVRVARVMRDLQDGLGLAGSSEGLDRTQMRMNAVGSNAGSIEAAKAAVEAGAFDPAKTTNEASISMAREFGMSQARVTARIFQREDSWRTDRALARFVSVLTRLSDLPPPKAVLYFADTMRANAGDHYLALLRTMDPGAGRGMPSASFGVDGGLATNQVIFYQRAIDEASVRGARLYTVQAEGLAAYNPFQFAGIRGMQGLNRDPMALTARFRQAQQSLGGLAAETGGRAFLNGASLDYMISAIRSDLSCLYLVSFDPKALPQDRRLSLYVAVRKPGVRTRARTHVVVESASSQLESRLTAAFSAPTGEELSSLVRGVVIPTGFADGKFTALVQIAVAGRDEIHHAWDFGVSLLAKGEVRDTASGSLSVTGRGAPVIFETEMSFRPGEYELIAVAHETGRDQISTARLAGVWPDPGDEDAAIGPIALLQPTHGAFLRGDRMRGAGPLGRAEHDLVRADLPIALVGIVCHRRGYRRPLRVERSLVGESRAEFSDVQIAPDDERCAVFSDTVRAGAMTPGGFRYEVRVYDGEREIASGSREFAAVEIPESAAARHPALSGSLVESPSPEAPRCGRIRGVTLRNALFALYVVACALAMTWPVYAWLGNRIEPFVLGLPFSLVWVIGWVLMSFVVLITYHATAPQPGQE